MVYPESAALIERALAWHHGDPWDDLDQTLAFMRYALALALPPKE